MRVFRQRRLEVIGSWERSVVGERHGASSLTTRNSAERLGARGDRGGFSFSGQYRLLVPLHLLQYYGMLSKGCVSFAVPL